jgi:D-alanyl-D-alanine carboxypeptidase
MHLISFICMIKVRTILSYIAIIRMHIILLLPFMFVLNLSKAMVQNNRDSSRIKEIIDSARIINKVNGIQLCIIDSLGNKTNFTSGYQNKKDKPITSDMILRIGSTTKLFTNYLILKLVQDSVISLNDKLSKWYPGFPNAERITIRNLLMHKSGVAEILRFPEFLMKCSLFPHKLYSIAELIMFLSDKSAKKANQPNIKYEYSNSNYILLGGIAEKIYKAEYKNLIDSLAKKINLPNTSYILPKNKELLVNGYDKDLVPFHGDIKQNRTIHPGQV